MSQRIVNTITAALVDKQGVELTYRDDDDMFLFFVKGGTLTYNQETETKISGQLDVSIVSDLFGVAEFSDTIIGKYIRIYINHANIGRRKLLATMLPSVKDMDNIGITYSGSLELKSTLCALTENQVRKTSLKKGTNIFKKFCQYAKNYACEGLQTVVTDIGSDKKNLTFKKNKVFQSGTTVYEIMNYMAKLMGAYITVNAKGQIYLKSKRSAVNDYLFTDYKDFHSFYEDIVYYISSNITISDNGIPINRVIATFEKTENKTTTRYYSKPVVLNADNSYSRANLGRNITTIVKASEEDLKDQGANMNSASSIKNKLTAIAKNELLEKAEQNYTYTFKCPYIDELKLDDRVSLLLEDICGSLQMKVTAFDIDLSKGCEMSLTCNSSYKAKIKTQTGKAAKL